MTKLRSLVVPTWHTYVRACVASAFLVLRRVVCAQTDKQVAQFEEALTHLTALRHVKFGGYYGSIKVRHCALNPRVALPACALCVVWQVPDWVKLDAREEIVKSRRSMKCGKPIINYEMTMKEIMRPGDQMRDYFHSH